MSVSQPPVPDLDDKQPRSAPFPIVGIGASAGGLDAFTQLVGALSTTTGMAFVLIQHLSPDHPSLLTDILSRSTSMPVCEIQDGMLVVPNHIYVIPPNTSVTLGEGALHLRVRSSESPHLPIDQFFLSLAEEQRRLAIGVILSGTGSDGTHGIRAIKEECGIVLAQDETSAQYGGMPHSARESGAVDFVLPPKKMAEQLTSLSHNRYVVPPSDSGSPEVLPEGDAELRKLFLLLERVTRTDFATYKQTTIRRRIGRRMVVRQCEDLGEYLAYVQEQPQELDELYKDLLISVTSFFRDPASYAALMPHFAEIVHDCAPGGVFRVWVPGCATGEEVYSLAICFREMVEREGLRSTIQLFGTDLSETSLRYARSGIYPERIRDNVSPDRISQFFRKIDGGYQISKTIRDTCLFARQDLTRDPPFSRIDLLSCRNLLIYLGSGIQKTVFSLFHYSLNPQGILFLGSAETVAEGSHLFQALDGTHKIYGRRSAPARLNSRLPSFRNSSELVLPIRSTQQHLDGAKLQKRAERAIQDRYAPDGVVINTDLHILQFRGQTGFYLEPMPGEATHNLLRLAHESLQPPLRKLLSEAVQQNIPVQQKGVRIEHRGEVRDITLEVIPISGEAPHERYYLVVFDPVSHAADRSTAVHPSLHSQVEVSIETEAQEIARLRRELVEAREYSRAETQDYEAALEELRAANEEVSSANEELQSVNEQLATTKEELQSTNEELTTVNDELEGRNQQLSILSNDLTNVLSAVDIPILMVDRYRRLRRFTPAAAKLFHFTADDLGRPLCDVSRHLPWPELDGWVEAIFNTVVVIKRELQDEQDCWWALSITPYRTENHRIDGAVLTFTDIDLLHRNLTTAQEALDLSDAIVNTIHEPLLVLTPELRIDRANPAFYRTFQELPEQTTGRRLQEIGSGHWNIPALRHALENVLPHQVEFSDVEIQHAFPNSGTKSIRLNGRRIVRPDGSSQSILLAIEDVSVWRQAEQALTRSNTDLQQFALVVSHDLQEPLRSVGKFTGLLAKRYQGQLDTEAAELMQFVLEGVQRMSALIKDVLAYANITQPDSSAPRPVSVQAALRESLGNLQAAIAESGALITHENLPTMVYDPRQLSQLFQNLIGNAIKYRRPQEPPQIYIAVERQSREWIFSIRDNGIGFESAESERIFSVFKRLHGREVAGTGIGLAICRRIVEHHGGRIWAESAPGVGSTFSFTVPV